MGRHHMAFDAIRQQDYPRLRTTREGAVIADSNQRRCDVVVVLTDGPNATRENKDPVGIAASFLHRPLCKLDMKATRDPTHARISIEMSKA